MAGGIQNPLDVRSERSELEESRRHYAVIMHTYDLPRFKSQRGILGRALGAWSFTGVWTATTGRLYAPGLTAAARQVASRPDVVGEWYLPASQRSIFRYFKLQLRVESFNTMNLADINTQLGNRSFGQISGLGSARYFQFGLKLIW